MKKMYAAAIEILAAAAKGERMKASIGGPGSLAESCCTRRTNELEAAVAQLEIFHKEDNDEQDQNDE